MAANQIIVALLPGPGSPYRAALMDPVALAVVVGSVLVAALVSTVSGFGFALLSVPLMTFAVDTRTAVVVSTLSGIAVTTLHAWTLRRHAERAIAGRIAVAAYAGMPIGIVIFTTVSEQTLLRLLGLSVVAAVILLVAGLDLSHRGRGLDLGAGFVSGILSTTVSTNGPPIVFALQARRLAADPFRGTIATVFALANLGATLAFVVAGEVNGTNVATAAATLPAIWAGQRLGLPLRSRVQGDRFRYLVLALLIVVGIRAVIASF